MCVTVTRGKYPSCTAWWVSEKTPVMSDCEAMMVAAVESATSAYVAAPVGTMAKNGLVTALASRRTSAPCPR